MNRTTAITIASVGGVLLAGAAVIGANVGILNAADASSELGALSVASTEPPYEDTIVEATPVSHSYQVDTAGTVEVIEGTAGLSFGAVEVTPGWTWEQTGIGIEATGRFTSDAGAIDFAASVNGDGLAATIASVDDDGTVADPSPLAPVAVPISSGRTTVEATQSTSPTTTVTAPPATAPTPETTGVSAGEPTSQTEDHGDDGHDEDGYDDHDDDGHDEDGYDDHDDEDHDDDDDDDHHEGRDDDD